jgi:outer membrane lipoprotein SlyB
MTNNTSTFPAPPQSSWARNAWLVAGGLALAAAGVAAGLAWRPAPETELVAPGSLEATRASLAPHEAIVEPAEKPADEVQAAAETKPAPKKSATQAQAQRSSRSAARAGHGSTPLATRQTALCSHCGVVEGVREVREKGQGTGLGAIAGGVVGAAVGNQAGKGNGRKAMTVLGAIGGGLAGNEIEKRARGETVYEVQVRMDDGSLRTLRQKTAPMPGARVTVDGNTLRTTRAPGGDGSLMRTSTGA